MSNQPALYMVIERFRPGRAPQIYRRARECGRTLPPGLDYLDSRVDLDLSRCFQLMRTADPALIESWIGAGNDLLEFEVIPVQGSADASRAADAGR